MLTFFCILLTLLGLKGFANRVFSREVMLFFLSFP